MKIIADIGSNYTDKKDLFSSIALAAYCNVDVFKIQYFNKSDLYCSGHTEKSNIDLDELSEGCKKLGIEFMASVFNEKDVQLLSKHINRFKVASAEAKHYPLLNAIADTGMPVVISTGCYDNWSYLLEIFDPELVTLMYCVSDYPARTTDPREIENLMRSTPFQIGYSDHSSELVAAAEIARTYGCTLIERHFNPLGFSIGQTADAGPHSLSIDAMRYYCRYLKGMQVAPFIDKPKSFRRRPIAIRDINPGEKIIIGENWEFLRPKFTVHDNEDINYDFFHKSNIMAIKKIVVGEALTWSNCGIYSAF